MKADYIIKNGHIIDPSQNIDKISNLVIDKKKIVGVFDDVSDIEAAHVVEAEGCIVTAGWIDCHVHLFEGCGMGGFKPDAFLLPMGVTSAFDAGSPGPANYKLFSREIVDYAWANIKGMLNCSSVGLSPATFYPENLDPKYFPRAVIREIVEEYRDEIIAMKIRISKQYTGELGLKPLEGAIDVAEEVGLPLVVHTTNPAGEVADILNMLRPGDVYAHCFHNQGNTLLGPDGKILDCVYKAREKGIIFDVSNGKAHFAFTVGKACVDQGFYPDTISTDINNPHLYNEPTHSLPYVMSKFLNMGMPIGEIIDSVTYRSAKVFNLEDQMGTLRPGVPADVTIAKVKDYKKQFFDMDGVKLDGDRMIVPQMTFLKGKVVFTQLDF